MTPEQSDSRINRITTGAIWRHKRDRHRLVRVTAIWPAHDGTRYASVERNTSRRRQAIKETTLLRQYEYSRHGHLPGRRS
jgi:hypothetical protein